MSAFAFVSGSIAAATDTTGSNNWIAHGISSVPSAPVSGSAIVAILNESTAGVAANGLPNQTYAKFSRSATASATVNALVILGCRGVQF